MFLRAIEQLTDGLKLAWDKDIADQTTDYPTINAMVNQLLSRGPCLDGRISAMIDAVYALDLLTDVARSVPDVAGKDMFAQSDEYLRVFRDEALEAFAKAHTTHAKDSVAFEANPDFLRD